MVQAQAWPHFSNTIFLILPLPSTRVGWGHGICASGENRQPCMRPDGSRVPRNSRTDVIQGVRSRCRVSGHEPSFIGGSPLAQTANPYPRRVPAATAIKAKPILPIARLQASPTATAALARRAEARPSFGSSQGSGSYGSQAYSPQSGAAYRAPANDAYVPPQSGRLTDTARAAQIPIPLRLPAPPTPIPARL